MCPRCFEASCCKIANPTCTLLDTGLDEVALGDPYNNIRLADLLPISMHIHIQPWSMLRHLVLGVSALLMVPAMS